MNPHTFATVLMAMALDRFGTDVMSFEPETIRMELRQAYGQDIPQVNMDKLLAMIAVLTTNLFYVSVETFHQVCDAFGHNEPNFYELDIPDPEDLAWGIAEVTLNDGNPGKAKTDAPEYSHEVKRYIGVVLNQYGITSPPPILSMAEIDPPANQMADDPGMVRAYYESQRREKDDITMFVKEQTRALLRQLHLVPLQNRDPKVWASFSAKAQERLGPWTASGLSTPA